MTGVAVDTIKHLGESVPVTATLPQIFAICRTWETSNVWGAVYNGGGTLIDAFVKTLLCGQVKEDQAPNSVAIPTLEEARRAFPSSIQNFHTDSGARACGDVMRIYLRGRRFGTGQRGYMGAFPATAQTGDQICVALGSYVPLLRRPVTHREGHFSLVGECYVAGLMAGEAFLGLLPDS
jgi:hypothetical protein